jgi:hypothetical protein
MMVEVKLAIEVSLSILLFICLLDMPYGYYVMVIALAVLLQPLIKNTFG